MHDVVLLLSVLISYWVSHLSWDIILTIWGRWHDTADLVFGGVWGGLGKGWVFDLLDELICFESLDVDLVLKIVVLFGEINELCLKIFEFLLAILALLILFHFRILFLLKLLVDFTLHEIFFHGRFVIGRLTRDWYWHWLGDELVFLELNFVKLLLSLNKPMLNMLQILFSLKLLFLRSSLEKLLLGNVGFLLSILLVLNGLLNRFDLVVSSSF